MNTVLGFLALITIILGLIGLYKPSLVLRWHENPSRWKVFGYCFFILFLVVPVLYGFFVTPEEKAKLEVSRKEREEKNRAEKVQLEIKEKEQEEKHKVEEAEKTIEQNKRVAEISANFGKDPEDMLEELEDIAKTGNSLAIARLAPIYELGLSGIKKDSKKAMDLWKTLYEKNDANFFIQATRGIGNIYKSGGDGINQDYEQAAIWLKKAYSQRPNNKDEETARKMATISLSDLYFDGKGVPCDANQAVQLMREAGGTEQSIRMMFAIRQQQGLKECIN